MNILFRTRFRSIMLSFVVQLAFLLGCRSEGKSDDQSPVKTTVCELVADPTQFDHKQVVFYGEPAGGVEGLALFDPHCPGKGVVLLVEDAAQSHPDFKYFHEVVNRELALGTRRHQVSAKFQGAFSFQHVERNPYRLTASQVSNVRVEENDQSKQ